MDGQMAEEMIGWQMAAWMYGCMIGLLDVWLHGWMAAWMDGGWIPASMYGSQDG